MLVGARADVNTPAFGGVPTPSSRSDQPAEAALIVFTESYYTNRFQAPGHAEAILERDVRHALDTWVSRACCL